MHMPKLTNALLTGITSFALFVVLLMSVATASNADQSKLRAALAGYLNDLGDFPLETRRRAAALKAFYLAENAPLLWSKPDIRRAMITRMAAASLDGLKATDFPVERLRKLNKVAAQTDDAGRAIIELWFSTYFLKYTEQLKVGRVLPAKIDPNLYWQPKRIDMTGALTTFGWTGDINRFFDAWQPSIPDYRRLRVLLLRYLAIAEDGGWGQVDPGDVLKPGVDDQRVLGLRARIQSEYGPLANGGLDDSETYDAALVDAVKAFQRRHGLDADGVLGKRTLLQLNIPVELRVRQIVANMERWRWMPEKLGDHYIMVNIAGFELRRVRDRVVEERMRVVVGKPYHQTPVFSDQIEYVEINPYWNVPYSIATKEELPKLQKDPSARAAKGFEAMVGNKPVDLRSIDWSQYSRKNFPLRIRQRPGDNNALGRVKLMFPNRFSVYMHDTPARTLFGRSARAFSHGCIRLARPIDMTEQVLADVPGWSRQRIDAVLTSKKNTRVSLRKPLPVHVTYATAWLDEQGEMQFRQDIYSRDLKLMNALFGKFSPGV